MVQLTAAHRTEAFDTVRPWLDRKGWTEDRIDQFDSLLDRFGIPRPPIVVRANRKPKARRISPAGIELIHEFEQCARAIGGGRFAAYPDPGSGGAPWTIGWGSTGPGIGPGTVWTQAQCDARFERDAVRFAADVERAIGSAPTSQAQFDALVAFAYNVGLGAFERSTLLKRHKAGDFDAAAREFARWNKAGGRVMKGLTRRRAAEAALYRKGS